MDRSQLAYLHLLLKQMQFEQWIVLKKEETKKKRRKKKTQGKPIQ